MFSPKQKAHGLDTMPSCQGAHQSLEAHGPVTWSGHMVYRTVKSNST